MIYFSEVNPEFDSLRQYCYNMSHLQGFTTVGGELLAANAFKSGS